VWAVRCVIKCMLEHMFVPLNTKLEYKMLVLLNSQIYYKILVPLTSQRYKMVSVPTNQS